MESIRTKFIFLLYRYKFLILYIIYGVLSLGLELFIVRTLNVLGFWYFASAIVGLLSGILLMFILNIKFNFKIAKPKQKRALLYFVGISLISFGFQYIVRMQIHDLGISKELTRVLTAGTFFGLFYWIHRRITFSEYKKVGVAIYADGVEDIRKRYEQIHDACDFIHIDIVDNTFKKECADIKAYRAEVVRAYWPKKQIEVHIMSRTPSIWLKDILPHVNTVFIHTDIDENVDDVLKKIRNAGCNPGCAVSLNERLDSIYPYLDSVNYVLLLAINNPGYSNQVFNADILPWIAELDKHKFRSKFSICVDGGVNNSTIKRLSVESVVSGSFILNSENPIKQIMLLQTSGEYERH